MLRNFISWREASRERAPTCSWRSRSTTTICHCRTNYSFGLTFMSNDNNNTWFSAVSEIIFHVTWKRLSILCQPIIAITNNPHYLLDLLCIYLVLFKRFFLFWWITESFFRGEGMLFRDVVKGRESTSLYCKFIAKFHIILINTQQ